jgi:hypothetical protein
LAHKAKLSLNSNSLPEKRDTAADESAATGHDTPRGVRWWGRARRLFRRGDTTLTVGALTTRRRTMPGCAAGGRQHHDSTATLAHHRGAWRTVFLPQCHGRVIFAAGRTIQRGGARRRERVTTHGTRPIGRTPEHEPAVSLQPRFMLSVSRFPLTVAEHGSKSSN